MLTAFSINYLIIHGLNLRENNHQNYQLMFITVLTNVNNIN